MMYQEFTAAFETASKEAGKISDRWHPTPMQWSVLQDLYTSDELDAVCTGRDRHLKFARWVIANEKRVLDLVDAKWFEANERVAELTKQRYALDARIEMISRGLA